MSSRSRLLKRLAGRLLLPIAVGINRFYPLWCRVWAHTKLRARLGDALASSCVIHGPVEVHGTANIQIGEDVLLYPGIYLETQARGRIEIESGVVLSRGVHIVAYDEVVLKRGCMVGEYASIRDANHEMGTADLRHSGHDASAIRIGAQAWIGRGAAILKGVSVGDCAVVGANAVVTKDIPAHAVALGVPARVR